MRLARHIAALAAEHCITVQPRVSEGARAFKRERIISVPPVRDPITYFTALHELGHIVHPRGSGAGLRLEKEYFAWVWALENAIIQPTPAIRKLIHGCLMSYVRAASRSKRMRTLEKEHPIWNFITRLEHVA